MSPKSSHSHLIFNEALLETYPRVRQPLTPAHHALYITEYIRNRSSEKGLTAIVSALEGWMHRKVAHDNSHNIILELGAGSLNHVPYEISPTLYDVIEPFHALWESSPHCGKVNHFFDDINDIPLDSLKYDRIISVAVLEHLTHLPYIVARCGLLLDKNGKFQAGIPSEGGFLWGLAWRLTTGIAYRLRTKLDYKTIMRHEHVNTANEIISIVRYFFHKVKIKRFPLPFHHLSFYAYLEACNPNLERCKHFLEASTTKSNYTA